MRKYLLATALGSLVLVQPAFAQDGAMEVIDPDSGMELSEDASSNPDGEDSEEMDAAALAMITGIFATMFEADPLTPEAEARLPAATAVATSLVPEGVYGEMMGQMLDSFLSPILELAESDGGGMSASDLTEYTGLYGQDLDSLTSEQRIELTQMFDPVYETRTRAQFDMIIGTANSVFATLEPGVRDGLAKAYASRFEASELAALNAFFATPVGAKYASQSLVINTDPQVISGMMQAIPNMLEQLPAMIEGIEDAEAGLPEPRGYDDLTPSEQRRASEILGVDQPTLRESMANAEAMAEANVWEAAPDVMVEATAADTEANLDAMAEEMDAWSSDEMEEAEAVEDVETEEMEEATEEAMDEVGGE